MTEVALEIRDLRVTFETDEGEVHAVRGVDLTVGAGEIVGLVGESGSGKTATMMASLGLAGSNARVEGSVELLGREILGLPERRLVEIRGREIALVPQDPMGSLNPRRKVGSQMIETIMLADVGRAEARRQAVQLFERVGLPEPEKLLDMHPHELSGGMRQRVLIALAVARGPKVLVADEATTALDVTTQARILQLLTDLRDEYGMAVVVVTHDLGVVAELADRVTVMYGGRVAERGTVADIFDRAVHPYTTGLIASIPRLDGPLVRRLPNIPGTPITFDRPVDGCPFALRCPRALDRCWVENPVHEPVGAGSQTVACFNPMEAGHVWSSVVESLPEMASPAESRIVLRVENLTVDYGVGGPPAVDAVSFEVARGETLAVVGESGSGKSSLIRGVLQLEPRATSGQVYLNDVSLSDLNSRQLRKVRAKMKVVFQDPFGSLNPRLTVLESVAEPLVVAGDRGAEAAAGEILEHVGIPRHDHRRYPHEFSGGQRQRIGIARALVARPEIVFLDEPVSALDVSVQAQVLNLLSDLKDELGLTYVFVAHDLSVVRHFADRVMVMCRGEAVETGPRSEIFGRPQHPYTISLLEAVPNLDAWRRRSEPVSMGED